MPGTRWVSCIQPCPSFKFMHLPAPGQCQKKDASPGPSWFPLLQAYQMYDNSDYGQDSSIPQN